MEIKALSSYIRRKDMDSVLNCLVTDSLAPGEFNDRLMKTAKERLSFNYGIALRSPYHAFSIALRCLDLEPGSVIALSAFSEPWVLDCLSAQGFLPFWLDVEPSTCLPGAQSLETLSGSGAKALYLAQPWGVFTDPALLLDIGIPIIEDISTTIGSVAGGEIGLVPDSEESADKPEIPENSAAPESIRAGELGMFTILGLEHAHAVTAGGGAILYAKDRREAQVLKNICENISPTLKLGDMNCALAFSQLRDLDKFIEKRSELAKLFEQSLARAHKKALVQAVEGKPAYYSCVVVLESGIKDVIAYAKKKDIPTLMAFEMTCIGIGAMPEGSCPHARSLVNRALAFPLHPRIGKGMAQKIAKVLATLP